MKRMYYLNIGTVYATFTLNIILYIIKIRMLNQDDKNKNTINKIMNQYNSKFASKNYYYFVHKKRYLNDIRISLEGKNILNKFNQMSIFYILDAREAKKFIKKYNKKEGIMYGDPIPSDIINASGNKYNLFKDYGDFCITGFIECYNGITFLAMDLIIEDTKFNIDKRIFKNKNFIKPVGGFKFPFHYTGEKSFLYYYNFSFTSECLKINSKICKKMKISGFCLLNINYGTRKNNIESLFTSSTLQKLDNKSLSGVVEYYFENGFITYSVNNHIDSFEKIANINLDISKNYIYLLENIITLDEKLQNNLLTLIKAKQYLTDNYNFQRQDKVDEIISVAKFINDTKNTLANKRIGTVGIFIGIVGLLFAGIELLNLFLSK